MTKIYKLDENYAKGIQANWWNRDGQQQVMRLPKHPKPM